MPREVRLPLESTRVVALLRHGVRAPLPGCADTAQHHAKHPWPDLPAWGVRACEHQPGSWGDRTARGDDLASEEVRRF